jgi:hypothetical protein
MVAETLCPFFRAPISHVVLQIRAKPFSPLEISQQAQRLVDLESSGKPVSSDVISTVSELSKLIASGSAVPGRSASQANHKLRTSPETLSGCPPGGSAWGPQ